ncbi:hypothetical protein AQI94_30665 [Streptomyces pseudovenezuelae]|uniref:UbiC transcription regulator-associated domain-containing protein n=1 Tax=Streptomyces pseudovenezuelae TaxID=67350 RepID=A0A101N1M5_9ACTN|nr:hypothetical protein AQI94_30665 [Streptomyces pseudovenezuelae]
MNAFRWEVTPSAEELAAGDLYEHLCRQRGVRVRESVQAIEPTVVTRAEAELLDVPELSWALLFERLTSSPGGVRADGVARWQRGRG